MQRITRRLPASLLSLVGIAFAVPVFLSAPACTTHSENPTAEVAAPFQTGRAPFRESQYREASFAEIAKHDRTDGDQWSLQLTQRAPDEPDWFISSPPAGRKLADPRADGKFIQHLLDTMTTLRVADIALSERDPQKLDLVPPVYQVKWKDRKQEYELRVGKIETGERRYATLRVGTLESPPVVVQGAALKMLSFMKSFDVLRSRVLLNFDADEIDEFTLKRFRQPPYYAQRHGSGWADQKKKKLGRKTEEWVEAVAHVRIRQFIDDLALSPLISGQIQKSPVFDVEFRDRKRNATRLILGFYENKLYAWISSRPESVSLLFPETLSRLNSL